MRGLVKPPRDVLTEGPYAGQWYVCRYCGKKRAVGRCYPCAAGNKVAWSPAPWGVACQPDENGVRTAESNSAPTSKRRHHHDV